MKIKLFAAALLLAASSAQATIATVFEGIPTGSAKFNTTVINAGGTVKTDIWTDLMSGTVIDRGDYSISRTNGNWMSVGGYGTMSGNTIDISPNDPSRDTLGSKISGITFTFDNPINSFGFEVGDWATCCHNPTTDLFISFDNGAPILVASASQYGEGLFKNRFGDLVHEIFVAAFDDSGTFSKVQFWGNGYGEYLVAGGQVKYALIDEGSLPPTPGVPAPASAVLLGLGLLALRLRKRA
ncbi:hypothetical protein [Rheinheimera sp.]|uniref:hypothetical protein n=1 Tax=Rheinheimera sp. TaxID=1869214 RepID=UPI003D272AA1